MVHLQFLYFTTQSLHPFWGFWLVMQRRTCALFTTHLKTFECFPNINPNHKFSIFLWSFILAIVPSAVFFWAVAVSISFPWRYVARGFVNEKMNFKTWNWKSQTATNRPRASTLVFESFSLLHCFKASRILKIWQCTDFTASNRQVQRVAQNDFSLMYFPNLSLPAKLFKIASLFSEWKNYVKTELP